MKSFFSALTLLFILSGTAQAQFSSDTTFDVTTWNIEWFGTTTSGPTNESLQLTNAAQVMATLGSDLFALQEIRDGSQLSNLVADLNRRFNQTREYSYIISEDFLGCCQRTAYVYDTDVVVGINGFGVFDEDEGQDDFDWAGRFPFFFDIDVEVNGFEQRILAINVHAKAFSDQESYQRRQRAANDLFDYLDTFRSNDPILFLGDYNDDVDVSIYQGFLTPYARFKLSDEFDIVTITLSEANLGSTVGRSSVIDHITISDELFDAYVDGSASRYVPDIDNYDDTTSDHYPISASLNIENLFVSNEEEVSVPSEMSLLQNYPNPFNPSTTIEFQLNQPQNVNLTVYNSLGQIVEVLVSNQLYAAGTFSVNFDASGLSSGLYFYTLSTEFGAFTQSMTLIK